MRNVANCVERQRCSNDKFQSYVCWMLFAGSFMAMLPPFILWITSNPHSRSNDLSDTCDGTPFTVYAHYSTHQWITEKFESFKEQTRGAEYGFDVCYELKIEDSTLDPKAKPAVWIPESFLWLDIADYQLETELVKNREIDCTSTTNVPFGIITWKKYAQLLSPDNTPIPFQEFIELAKVGWKAYDFMNGSIEDIYDGILLYTFCIHPCAYFILYTDVDEVYFAHGHPNVTSGGLLGFITAFSALNGQDSGTSFEFAHESGCSRDRNPDKNESVLQNIFSEMEAFENHIITTAPIDYTLPEIMMSRGPNYLQMTLGFENDVALFNEKKKSLIDYLWKDSLAFVYLSETYWLEHPICKLTGASWYDDNKARVAEEFVSWITGECSECIGGSHIGDLDEYGLRPINVTNADSIISRDNGCNPDIEADYVYSEPSKETVLCMMEKFGELKKDLRLEILLDVSANMNNIVDEQIVRWNEVYNALPLLVNNLAGATMIGTTCFNEAILEGEGCASSNLLYPNTTLENSRQEYIDHFEATSPKTGRTEVHLFRSLLETYIKVNNTRNQDPDHRYIILVLTEDDNSISGDDEALRLLTEVSLSYDPNQIRIYPILYYGQEDGLTFETLQTLAAITNGQFSTATAQNLLNITTEFTYYW